MSQLAASAVPAGRLPDVDSLGDLAGKRALVRSDLNVPMDGGRIADDGRIRASVPQIRALLDKGARVVVVAHLGRPKGAPDPTYSLAPVARRLSELLGRDVTFVADPNGDPGDADVTLLENVRFHAGEASKDDTERSNFAAWLASLADVYVARDCTCTFGAVIGAGLGVALVSALRSQGITTTVVPTTNLIIFLILAALLGIVAASCPARRAARLDILTAITTE